MIGTAQRHSYSRVIPAVWAVLAALMVSPVHAKSSLLSPTKFESDTWSTIAGQEVPTAGVRAPFEGFRSLSLMPKCRAGELQGFDVSFTTSMAPMYVLFVRQSLVPGAKRNLVAMELQVDRKQTTYLENPTVKWQSGLLRVTGEMPMPKLWPALEAGLSASVDIYLDENVIFTQTFSLSGSADALNILTCQ